MRTACSRASTAGPVLHLLSRHLLSAQLSSPEQLAAAGSLPADLAYLVQLRPEKGELMKPHLA